MKNLIKNIVVSKFNGSYKLPYSDTYLRSKTEPGANLTPVLAAETFLAIFSNFGRIDSHFYLTQSLTHLIRKKMGWCLFINLGWSQNLCLLLLLLTAFILNHSGPLHVIFKSRVQRRHLRKFSRLIKLDLGCWTNICFL